jgi:hypothetical protein
MYIMWCLAALVGGLYLGARDLVPYLAARSSGVIKRKGALNISVRRDTDPEGFASLLANRTRGAFLGLGLCVAGVVGFGVEWLALTGVSGPQTLLIIVAQLGFAIFAAYCLVKGLITGRMFAFWSLILFGDATRKQNPTWFWVYAAINVFIVLIMSLILLAELSR